MNRLSMPILKQPTEQLLHALAFGGVIASIDGVLVAPRGLVPQTTALTIGGQSIEPGAVQLRLDGGTDGETYLVTVQVTTAAGEQLEGEIEVLVSDLGFAMPDGSTPYVAVAQFVTRVGLGDTIRLTDEFGTGRIDKARLVAAIIDAQATVDSYLAKQFAVPIAAPIPQLVMTLVIDLAVARLYRTELPANVSAARDAAMRQLRDLANGTANLPAAEMPAPATTSSAPVLVDAGDRRFSRDRMKGW